MVNTNVKNSKLIKWSLKTFVVFVVLLFVVEITLFLKLSGIKSSFFRKGLTQEEFFLYKNSIKNFGILFNNQIRELESYASRLSLSILDDLLAERMMNIQAEFKSVRLNYPEIKYVFLFNRFGRILALEPFSEEIHNNIYDYTRYFWFFREKISRFKPSTAVYHWLFDETIKDVEDTQALLQPPFFTKKDSEPFLEKVKRQGSLIKNFKQNKLSYIKTPLLLVSAGCVSRGVFKGYVGFGISLSELAQKVLKDLSDNFIFIFAFNKDGRIIYSSSDYVEGEDLSHYPFVRDIVNSADSSGFLKYKGKIVFYYKECPVFYAGIPIKYFNMKMFSKIDWRIIAFFIFQLILFTLLFLIYYQRIASPLSSLIQDFAPSDIDSSDDISVIRTLLENSTDKTPVENFIFEPTLMTNIGMKVDEEKPQIEVKNLKVLNGSVVYISLRDISRVIENDLNRAVEFYRTIYRLALENDGVVKNFSFNSFMVYFGVPNEDSEHPLKATSFFTSLLSFVKESNEEQKEKIRIGVAAESGEFKHGTFVFGKIEEEFILSPVVYLVQKYEVICGDNVAVFSDNFFQVATNVEDRYIRKRATIKIRDLETEQPLDVYIYRI